MNNNIINLKKDNYWVPWFIGFSDAEGSFGMYPKKRYLVSGDISKINIGFSYHLSLHKRDAEIIKLIRENLNNIGVIYEYKDKPDIRLAINDKPSLLYINNIFDAYSLLTKHQLTRYLLFKQGIMNEITEFKTEKEYLDYKSTILSSIDKEVEYKYKLESMIAIPWIDSWIIGFINGEGCFYLNKNKCNFMIEHIDRLALELIKYKLGFGPNVIERAPRARDEGKTIKTTYMLNISSKKDINNLILLLDNKNNMPLQGHKLIQYNEWKEKWDN